MNFLCVLVFALFLEKKKRFKTSGNSPFIKFLSSLQMIARGKNASDLFPAVVKNVACKNIEVSYRFVDLKLVRPLFPLAYIAGANRKTTFSCPDFWYLFFKACKLCFFCNCVLQKPQRLWSYLSLIRLQFTFAQTPWTVGFHLAPCLLQVKKLVYVYLVRYAEEQQDLALLSISTFQRGLKVCSTFLALFARCYECVTFKTRAGPRLYEVWNRFCPKVI